MKWIFSLLILTSALSPLPSRAQGQLIRSGAGQATLQSGNVVTNLWMPVTNGLTIYYAGMLNTTANTVWLMAFDTNTTNIAAGTVPTLEAVPTPANTIGGWNEMEGLIFKNGLVVAASTTPYSFTNAGPTGQGRLTYYNAIR